MSAARRMLSSAPSAVRALCRPLALASLILVVLGVRPVAAQTEVIEYYGQDALGSIRIVFNADGVATARADFEPFGELFTVPGMPGGQLPAQQFTGQERDPEASQDYFGARFLTPRTGRFSQIDPVYAGLYDPQQWNRYAYVRNSPLSFVDPDGLNPQLTACSAAAQQCKGEETVTVRATYTPPVGTRVTTTIDLPTATDPAAEGLAAKNNSCQGDGNSRACGGGGNNRKGRDGGWKITPADRIIGEILLVQAAGAAAVAAALIAAPVVAAATTTLGLTTGAATAGTATVVFGHGARHLPAGLSAANVEAQIVAQIQTQVQQSSGYFSNFGLVEVEGVVLQYRAFVLPNGWIKVGTYFPFPGKK